MKNLVEVQKMLWTRKSMNFYKKIQEVKDILNGDEVWPLLTEDIHKNRKDVFLYTKSLLKDKKRSDKIR